MFLLWVESTMRDFIVLNDGGEDMRQKYNNAFGKENHPSDFALERLKIGRCDFSKIKEKFVSILPEEIKAIDVVEAIERSVIYRNAFGHAQVQLLRPFLLYTPKNNSLDKIKKFTKCGLCGKTLKDCQCEGVGYTEPTTLVLRCLEPNFLKNFYADIRTVDLECFVPTAKHINVKYRGPKWPSDPDS